MATADIQKEVEKQKQPGDPPKKGKGADNRGADFGTSEPATAGTNRDADRSGESKNQGHGHPEE
ncbi:hypothetical protein BH20GEM2_BH20GEM2_18380 [soil metagenome]|jgi:hypothetical protein